MNRIDTNRAGKHGLLPLSDRNIAPARATQGQNKFGTLEKALDCVQTIGGKIQEKHERMMHESHSMNSSRSVRNCWSPEEGTMIVLRLFPVT